MAQGSFHGCCVRHRVDAAARPNLYPDWPETPEQASIVVNHTARYHVYPGASAYCFMDPRSSIWVGTSSDRVLQSLLPLLLPLCGAADFTGRKHSPRGMDVSDHSIALAFFFFFFFLPRTAVFFSFQIHIQKI